MADDAGVSGLSGLGMEAGSERGWAVPPHEVFWMGLHASKPPSGIGALYSHYLSIHLNPPYDYVCTDGPYTRALIPFDRSLTTWSSWSSSSRAEPLHEVPHFPPASGIPSQPSAQLTKQSSPGRPLARAQWVYIYVLYN